MNNKERNEPLGYAENQALQVMVEAALSGHDLGHWRPLGPGWMATCKVCTMSVWVGENGRHRSLLAGQCPGYENR